MVNVTIVYDDLEQIKDFKDTTSYKFKFIDSKSRKGKKEAWRVKNYYGAKLDPFVVILDNEKPIKAFYSEAEDVINSLTKFIKTYE